MTALLIAALLFGPPQQVRVPRERAQRAPASRFFGAPPLPHDRHIAGRLWA